MESTGGSRRSLVLVCVLAALFAINGLYSSVIKSATFDEPVHLTAGLSYVETGRIVIGTEHTPLLKELVGLSLRSAGIRWPATEDARALLAGRSTGDRTVEGILVDNGPERVLFWARLPLILVTTTLVLLVYLAGRRIVGDAAALGAAFLTALDPNLLGHSYLVTTDPGLATMLMLFILALWEFIHRPGIVRAALCGVALGASLGAKYTAVVLAPLGAVLLGLALVRPPVLAEPAVTKKRAERRKPQAPPRQVPLAARYAVGYALALGVAFFTIQVIYLFPDNPLQYLDGWRNIYGGAPEDFQAYMAGRLEPRFTLYYVVAYLLKEPIASIGLAATGLILLFTNTKYSWLTRAFLLLPPALLLAGYTARSFNIGIRYLLPVLPFAHLLGGVALAMLFQSRRVWARAVGAVACVWVVLAAVGVYPDNISYFNEAACILREPSKVGLDGGTRCGPAWLNDSNVDWGQGLVQLEGWLDENAPGRQVHLAYFGSVKPEIYGIDQVPVTDEEYAQTPTSGLYAVSAHFIAYIPARYREVLGSGAEWLLADPTAIVGHALYIFDFDHAAQESGAPPP